MLNYQQAFYDLRQLLNAVYDGPESAAIAHEVLHEITGKDKLQRLMEKDSVFMPAQQERFLDYAARLQSGMPMQYVLGYAWFAGRIFKVNEQVLIPRPETEELVQWVIDDLKISGKFPVRILDIGTGSGCIPISVKLALETVSVSACDISPSALELASENANQLGADVHFFKLDILDAVQWKSLPGYDLLVSNPPYIPITEKDSLHRNVKDFEPALALFTPADDAQLFYRAVARMGCVQLTCGGTVYCEVHADHGGATAAMFREAGYQQVILRNDMHGNPRMIRATWPG
jgi:release factor glutamine methyltransferase